MDVPTFLIQCLNAVQYGLLLFLVASGLTLIFGIMGVINLAHGSFYMLGAYLAYGLAPLVETYLGGGLFATLVIGVALAVAFGYLLEWLFFSYLYEREHLQQVLMTYGLILVFEEVRSMIAGDDVHGVATPDWLAGSIPLSDVMTYSYAAALITGHVEAASLWLVAFAALAASGAFAAVVGALSLRTRGVYFIMITLAFAQMAFFVAHDTPLGGGSDGIYLYYKPALTWFGRVLVDFEKGRTLYFATLAFLIATFGFLAMLMRSRYGRALAGIKANEQRMRAAGYATYPYKLGAFVIGAMIASLAGVLFAMKDGVVNPELMVWNQSGAVLLMIILGGLGHLRGAMLGALMFTVLQELYQSEAVFGSFAKHWQLMLGLTIIAFVATMPRGLIGLFDRQGKR